MNHALTKKVRLAFNDGLRKRVPQFAPSFEPIAPECRLYAWDLSNELRAYLMLQVHRNDDSFTIELAWTRNGRWPATYLRTPTSLDATPTGGDMRFRISQFWNESDYWWKVAPDDAIEIQRTVDEAVDRIVEAALPYFSGLAR